LNVVKQEHTKDGFIPNLMRKKATEMSVA
jgi:hypothetical protein